MKVLKINRKNYKEVLNIAGIAIKKEKVLVCPTDTVYGLVCNAANQRSVERLLKIKKRSAKKPIPIFVKDIKMAKRLARISKEQEKVLRRSWPGKTTFILKRKDYLPEILFGKSKTIGLRIPKYKLINQLNNSVLTGTSANISGKPVSAKIKEVISQFKSQKYQPDLIIDAGPLKPSKPSTVIDLTGKSPKVLRR